MEDIRVVATVGNSVKLSIKKSPPVLVFNADDLAIEFKSIFLVTICEYMESIEIADWEDTEGSGDDKPLATPRIKYKNTFGSMDWRRSICSDENTWNKLKNEEVNLGNVYYTKTKKKTRFQFFYHNIIKWDTDDKFEYYFQSIIQRIIFVQGKDAEWYIFTTKTPSQNISKN